MDIIDIDCVYYGKDAKSSCSCVRRLKPNYMIGFIKIGEYIPPCTEVSCISCNWKVCNPKEEKAKAKKPKNKKTEDCCNNPKCDCNKE